MLSRNERQTFAIASALTVLAAILYCSWPLGLWLNPVASRKGLASELAAWGQPYNWLFIWADIVSGAILLVGTILLVRMYNLHGWARRAMVLLAVYGVCGALDAALPMSCLPSEQVCGPIFSDPMLVLHGTFDLIGSITLIGTLVAASIFVHQDSRTWRAWIYVIGGGALGFALLSAVFFVFGGPNYWAQRYYITLSCVWVASMPFVLRPKRATVEELTQ